MTNIAAEKESYNPDDDLSIRAIVMKYQLDFTKHFGPKYAYGVDSVYVDNHAESIQVYARVKAVHKSTKGPIATFNVQMSKFKVWRKNVKLYTFIS